MRKIDMYEVGCIMWYLALNNVMGFYSFHCTRIVWVAYMLGWHDILLYMLMLFDTKNGFD